MMLRVHHNPQCRRVGFTLVELLIVLSIFLVLAAIALPTVKGLIEDQKVSRSTQSIIAFLNLAQNRAIAENRFVGVRFERLDPDTEFGRATSIRLRQLTGVPPYTGDSADATARLRASSGVIDSARFSANDNPLLLLSAQMIASGDGASAPIQVGDLFELPGGRTVPILSVATVPIPGTPPPPPEEVDITFDLREQKSGVSTFPASPRSLNNTTLGDPVKYRIHRRPVPSPVNTLSLPRGVAIDLNFSGVGLQGNQFAPAALPNAEFDVEIIFGPQGNVVGVSSTSVAGFPTSNIFFCVGRADGIVSAGEDLYREEKRATSNLRSLDSVWLVINANTGKAVASPMASLLTIPTDAADRQNLSLLGPSLAESRDLAVQLETLDSAQ